MTPFCICIDTREKLSLAFEGVPTTYRALRTGDYSVLGLEEKIAVERKTLSDLVHSLTFERERFDRELERLRKLDVGFVVVEGDFDAVVTGAYRSRATPQSLVGSIASWTSKGVPFVFVGSARNASILVERTLRKYHQHQQPKPGGRVTSEFGVRVEPAPLCSSQRCSEVRERGPDLVELVRVDDDDGLLELERPSAEPLDRCSDASHTLAELLGQVLHRDTGSVVHHLDEACDRRHGGSFSPANRCDKTSLTIP